MTFNTALVAFDLDGTLTESKQNITSEMSLAVERLLHYCDVAFISGCHYKQMTEQVADNIFYHPAYHKELYLLPTSGAQLYERETPGWDKVYDNDLTFEQKVHIYNTWKKAVYTVGGYGHIQFGDIAEDRGSQITFSMCGQNAPLKEKKKYDPDQAKRKRIVEHMGNFLNAGGEYEIRIGGTTSIDVTKKGLDKNYGISRLLVHTGYEPEEVIFMGDALYPGGNDEPVLETGVTCIEVSGPTETLGYINNLLEVKKP